MKKDKEKGMFLTLKQLDNLGIISLDKDHILVKKRKRKKRKQKPKSSPSLDYDQMKSQSTYMIGGGSSHQLRTPTVSSEQGLLNLRLTERQLQNSSDNSSDEVKKMLTDYQQKNDRLIEDGIVQINNRFASLGDKVPNNRFAPVGTRVEEIPIKRKGRGKAKPKPTTTPPVVVDEEEIIMQQDEEDQGHMQQYEEDQEPIQQDEEDQGTPMQQEEQQELEVDPSSSLTLVQTTEKRRGRPVGSLNKKTIERHNLQQSGSMLSPLTTREKRKANALLASVTEGENEDETVVIVGGGFRPTPTKRQTSSLRGAFLEDL